MKVITVTGLKGGSGKTSTVVPLACVASRTQRTLVLDLDPTPSASQWIEAAGLGSKRLASQRLDVQQLGRFIAEAREAKTADLIIIDTPPVYRDVCMQAMGEADLVVIPIHVGTGDLAQLVQTFDLMRLPLRANPDLKHLVLLNHAGTMPAVTRETRAHIEEFGAAVAKTEIPYRKAYVLAKGSRPSADWWHFDEFWREVRGALA